MTGSGAGPFMLDRRNLCASPGLIQPIRALAGPNNLVGQGVLNGGFGRGDDGKSHELGISLNLPLQLPLSWLVTWPSFGQARGLVIGGQPPDDEVSCGRPRAGRLHAEAGGEPWAANSRLSSCAFVSSFLRVSLVARTPVQSGAGLGGSLICSRRKHTALCSPGSGGR